MYLFMDISVHFLFSIGSDHQRTNWKTDRVCLASEWEPCHSEVCCSGAKRASEQYH